MSAWSWCVRINTCVVFKIIVLMVRFDSIVLTSSYDTLQQFYVWGISTPCHLLLLFFYLHLLLRSPGFFLIHFILGQFLQTITKTVFIGTFYFVKVRVPRSGRYKRLWRIDSALLSWVPIIQTGAPFIQTGAPFISHATTCYDLDYVSDGHTE